MDSDHIVYQIRQEIGKSCILLTYEGKVNQDIVKAFTRILGKTLEDEGTTVPVRKRVCHVMVECLQNMDKHAATIDSRQPRLRTRGIFRVSRSAAGFNVITGNPIANGRIERLTEMLGKVNGMNEEEISAYYKQKLVENRLSTKGGAGLGFIDIVKRTGNKISFRFEKVNQTTSFFIMQALISYAYPCYPS